ncbi:hypothetical protein METHP14_420012 [Pseudomonas sp. P14-2025]
MTFLNWVEGQILLLNLNIIPQSLNCRIYCSGVEVERL